MEGGIFSVFSCRLTFVEFSVRLVVQPVANVVCVELFLSRFIGKMISVPHFLKILASCVGWSYGVCCVQRQVNCGGILSERHNAKRFRLLTHVMEAWRTAQSVAPYARRSRLFVAVLKVAQGCRGARTRNHSAPRFQPGRRSTATGWMDRLRGAGKICHKTVPPKSPPPPCKKRHGMRMRRAEVFFSNEWRSRLSRIQVFFLSVFKFYHAWGVLRLGVWDLCFHVLGGPVWRCESKDLLDK